VGLLARGYAFIVVSLRLVIIGGWAAAAAAAIVFLPPLNPATGGLSELIPPGSPAAHAESDASKLFGFPLDAAVAVVQRDPRGLPTATQVRAVREALAADRQVGGQLGQFSQAVQVAQAAGVAEALATAEHLSTGDLTGPVSYGPPGVSRAWPERSRCPTPRAC
jgi:putative drug exporter of the RND superfamily